jgi:hypothetical protein
MRKNFPLSLAFFIFLALPYFFRCVVLFDILKGTVYMPRSNRGNEGTHSPGRDAGNERTQATGTNQPETTNFIQLTRQNDISSRLDNQSSGVKTFGGKEVGEGSDSPKRFKPGEASALASWEKAKQQLLQQQMAETKMLREQHPGDYRKERAMTQEHNRQLKDLLAKKPAETLPENDPSAGSNTTVPGESSSHPRGRGDAQAIPASLNAEIMSDIGRMRGQLPGLSQGEIDKNLARVRKMRKQEIRGPEDISQ